MEDGSFVENTIQIHEKLGDRKKYFFRFQAELLIPLWQQDCFQSSRQTAYLRIVDHGLLRKNEGDEVEAVFGPNGQFDLNFLSVSMHQEECYNKLAGLQNRKQSVKLSEKRNLSVFLKKQEDQ